MTTSLDGITVSVSFGRPSKGLELAHPSSVSPCVPCGHLAPFKMHLIPDEDESSGTRKRPQATHLPDCLFGAQSNDWFVVVSKSGY